MNTIMNLFAYFIKEFSSIISFSSEHIVLTAITVVNALLIGIPLGISVYYYKRTSKLVLGLANVIQAVPSLALLGFAIPFLGIGKLPAVVVVTLYSLLPIIKNTYIGISGIRPETIEASRGMGLTKLQILYKIQLPIALPVIMGGVRIASVTAVGVVTIAAFIGGGGLGYLIFSGIRTVNTFQILSGAVPACILALCVDFIFGQIENRLSSRRPTLKKKGKALYGVVISIAVVIAGFVGYNTFLKKNPDITVASKDFSEQIVLGHMLSEVIEDQTNLKVKRDLNLGGSSIIYEAITTGNVDMYFDYTGTIFVSVLNNEPNSNVDVVYNVVKKTMKKKHDIYTGKPVGFNNTFALAMMPSDAKKNDVKSISDLAKVANKKRLSSTIEFANRSDGLAGLLKKYNMKFKSSTPIDGSSRYRALETGKANVTDAFQTDGLIKKLNLVLLKDDKNYFPPYYAVPLVRQEVLDKHPELNKVLEIFENLISEEDMQEMNYRVDESGDNPKDVAIDFLKEKKILK